jgi:hypothetical protein
VRRFLFLLPLLALALPAGAGGDKFDPEARARALAPYIDELTIAVARVDLSRPDAEAVATKIAEMAGVLEEGDAAKRPLRRWLADFTGAGGKELLFLFSFADSSGPAVVAPLGERADAKAIAKLLGAGKLLPAGEYEKVGNAVVGGAKEARERLKDLKPDPRPELVKALAAAGDTTAQLLVLPTADNRRVIEELMPTLPKEIGGGPSTVLTRGVLWGAAGLSGPPKSSLQIVVQSRNAAAARGLRDWLGKALQALGESKRVQQLFPNFEKIAAAIKPEVAGDRLTLTLEEQQVAAILQPLARAQRQASALSESANNLKQLALAVWTYHDATNRTFPAFASRDKQGKPLLSWRVHLLPYMEQLQLYQQFKLEEPWDSPHNKKLIAKMPAIYRSPFLNKGEAGKTTYLAPRGKQTMWPDQGGLQVKDVTDGTSQTIQFVEVIPDRAVIWTKPDDLQVDLKKPHEGLVSKNRDRFTVALVDGSTHAVSANVSAATLRAAFTRGAGDLLGKDW